MFNSNRSTSASGGARASVALIVALIALVTSTSGAAYAVQVAARNSVVSTSIKNGQVKSKDLAANAVTGSKIADGTVGAADISVIRVEWGGGVSVSGPGMVSSMPVTARCPAGTEVIGGGAEWIDVSPNAVPHIGSSTVSDNGWKASGTVDFGSAGEARLRVTALCLA